MEYFSEKNNNKRLLVVPKLMIDNVIKLCHDNCGHIGIEKTMHEIKKQFWFSRMKKFVKNYISNCLTCIFYSPSEKKEGFVKIVDKGNMPFNTIHLDYYGPIQLRSTSRAKYVLVIVDAFTKFTKFFPTKSMKSDETIVHLANYMNFYSKPKKIITDRGTCFTAQKFKDFVNTNQIEHVKTAAYTPEANGQVERVNKTLTPMLAKLCNDTSKSWDKVLPKVEFVFNNTINRSTGNYPSVLLFGVQQNNLDCENVNISNFISNRQPLVETIFVKMPNEKIFWFRKVTKGM